MYLNGTPAVQNVVDKPEAAGGKLVVTKLKISDEYGYMAVVIDTGGSWIAVHSVPETYLSGNGG